ncbi:MAG: MerR family transcriptional regulator [Geodermatophilaceae bacterium]|jgi:DNA-binding transcriptional MerR regulator|nr:MerR family transcriptional regulator [Geodermatophilaceae bacterium]
MDSATVHTAAQTTGWSVRMLHYLDAAGLVSPPRSAGGYRLYGEREITHLRELRQLLADHDLRPADLQVALRLRSEPALRHAVDGWLDAAADPSATVGAPRAHENNHEEGAAGRPAVPDPATSWLRFEQDKHSRALLSHNTP